MIPLFILEEHNEAYFVWRYAINKKLIRSRENTLLHFDEHADMGSPKLNLDLKNLNGNLRKLANFTYNELNIANFIVPAIYNDIFCKVYWIKQRHNKVHKPGHLLYVRSFGERGQKLITNRMTIFGNYKERLTELQDIIKQFRYYKYHVKDIVNMKNVCLDIDLDFFSCNQDPLDRKLEIEISAKEYEDFKKDPYHRVKFFDFGRVDAIKKGDRCYYYFNNYLFKDVSPIKVERDLILRRIDEAIEAMISKKIKPQIITLCRSRFSGYTPEDQWKFIEDSLLEKLEASFGELDVVHISALIR